jgi:hypothetical protein
VSERARERSPLGRSRVLYGRIRHGLAPTYQRTNAPTRQHASARTPTRNKGESASQEELSLKFDLKPSPVPPSSLPLIISPLLFLPYSFFLPALGSALASPFFLRLARSLPLASLSALAPLEKMFYLKANFQRLLEIKLTPTFKFIPAAPQAHILHWIMAGPSRKTRI